MKTRIYLERILVGMFFFFQTSLLLAQNRMDPIKIPSPIKKIFVPFGFDSNDNTEIILQGIFETSCQKVGPVSAKAVGNVIEVEAYAYQYSGDCHNLPNTFIQTVKMGPLTPGNYQIKYKFNELIRAEPLNIVQTLRSEPDDYLYAPVSHADLVFEKRSGTYRVNVEGYFPNFIIGCMYLKEVKTYLAPGNVIVVQPIADMNREGSCHGGTESHHFKVAAKVDFPVSDHEYLVHVRVLNGDSYNQFIDHIQ